ncbi:MAG: hypothetical protein ABH956_00345 [Candidatus Nealsonbacteria bacterium]
MKWIKIIIFGVFIWILMFTIASAFIAFDIFKFTWTQGITALISGIIAFILAGKIRPNKISIALNYGLIWVVVGLALDALISIKFNSEIFSSWSLWLGYGLILLAPMLRIKKEEI